MGHALGDLLLLPPRVGSQLPQSPNLNLSPARLDSVLDCELGAEVVVGAGAPIGRGGTYVVYAGVLRGTEVAVKVLYTNTQEGEQEDLQRLVGWWVGGGRTVLLQALVLVT